MMRWTATISLYDDGETLRWSVRMWRVGMTRRTARFPDVKFTGSSLAPGSQEPTKWLQAALAALTRE